MAAAPPVAPRVDVTSIRVATHATGYHPPSVSSSTDHDPALAPPAWRSVIEHLDGAVIVVGLDGRIVMANAAALAYASTTEDPVGRLLWDLPEVQPVRDEVVRRLEVLGSGQPLKPMRLELTGGSDGTFVVSWHGTHLRDEHGVVTHVLLTGRDVTKQEEVETELRERDARLREAFERSDAVWWELDLLDGTGRWPEAAHDFYGLEPAAEPSLDLWRSRLHPDDLAADTALMQRLLEERLETFETVHRIVHPERGVRWIRSHGRLIYGATGAAERLVGIDTDVTERVEAEERTRQSETNFRTLANSLPQIVWTTGADGVVRYYNLRWQEFTGRPTNGDDAVGWLAVIHPDDRPEAAARWAHAVANGTPYTSQHRLERHDGAFRWHFSRALPMTDSTGRVTTWFGTSTDVHDHKVAALDLERRSTQQAAVAQLGIEALRSTDVAELMQSAIERLCEVLSLDVCKILRSSDDAAGGDGFVLEAASGLPEGLIGTIVPLDDATPSGITLRTSGRLIVEDLTRVGGDVRPSPMLREAGVRGGINVVIHGAERPYGVLAVYSCDEGRTFDDADADFVQAVSNLLAEAVKRRRTEAALETRVRRLDALHLIDTAMAEGTDVTIVLRTIIGHVREQLGVDAAAVFTFRGDLQTLRFAAGAGFRTTLIRESELDLGEGLLGSASMDRHMVHERDLQAGEGRFVRRDLLTQEDFRSYWGVPLIVKGELEGVLELYHRAHDEREPGWYEFLDTLATQTALALNNARLFNTLQVSNLKLRHAYDATIEGWARALELKDHQTVGHSRRVTELTIRLAERMGVSGDALIDFKRGALLHDIGKMGIPDRILLKAGELSPEEWEVMRSHPVTAYELLSPIEFLRNAIAIPYAHHERWDGSGYPNALAGEEIPLAARIFAVADVYDALTSERPYWPAWSKERALAYVVDESGRHFDPAVAAAFVSMISTT